jgi:broad specificity phosphatase PhoE
MTSIYLLRHGATASNLLVPYRLQGRCSDLPLDDRGREQVRRAAAVLAGLRFAAAYSSPLLRALETAQIVAQPHGLTPVVVPELTEADLGRWEGKTWEQIEASEPELFHQYHDHPGTVAYPEGESFLDVQCRVTAVLAGLASRHPDQAIVVVGHNVVNRAVLAGMLGVPIDLARSLRQANAGINLIEYIDGKPRVVMLNSCLHLGELTST